VTTTITHSAAEPPAEGTAAVGQLVHPLGVSEFLADFWEQAPVHLTGWPKRFAGLFDRDRLRAVLARQHELGLSVRVSSDNVDRRQGAAAHVAIDGADAAEHLRQGTSLCVDPIDRADPAVASLAAELKQALGHRGPVSVKCYFSTPGFGFNTHYDAHVVTTVQVEGTKTWRVSPHPGVAHPVGNSFLDAEGVVRMLDRTPASLRTWEQPDVDRDGFTEIVLRPGDVLCLPAGTWHEAKAGEEPSLALNFSFSPADVLDALSDQLRPLLEEHESWRAGLPAGSGLSAAWAATRLRELADAVAELADDVEGVAARLGDRDGHDGARRSGAAADTIAAAAARSADQGARRLQCVVAVSDAEQAARWYARVLDSEVVHRIPAYGWIEVSTPVVGVTLGLTEMPTALANRGAVLDFEVDDLDVVRRTLADNGVAVDAPTTEVAGLARMLTARDLDGNQLMFFEAHNVGGS